MTTTTTPTVPTIHQALAAVMRDVSPIAKEGRNAAQGFNFRGVDQVYGALHGPLTAHGVLVVPEVLNMERSERETKNGGVAHHVVLTVAYHFYGPAGDEIVAVVAGEAADSGDKATSKALSMAFKYAAFQVLCIPLSDGDADAETHEFHGRSRAPQSAQSAPSGPVERTAGGATVKQAGYARKLGKASPASEAHTRQYLAALGKAKIDELTGKECGTLIDELNALAGDE